MRVQQQQPIWMCSHDIHQWNTICKCDKSVLILLFVKPINGDAAFYTNTPITAYAIIFLFCFILK